MKKTISPSSNKNPGVGKSTSSKNEKLEKRIKALEEEVTKPHDDSEKMSELLRELQDLRPNLSQALRIAELESNLNRGLTDRAVDEVRRIAAESHTAREVRKIGYRLKQDGGYVRAIILYKISNDLYHAGVSVNDSKKTGVSGSPDEDAKWIINRLRDVKFAVKALVNENPDTNMNSIERGIAYMGDILDCLRALEGLDPEDKALKVSACILDIASVYDDLKLYNQSVELGEKGLTVLREEFGELCSNYKFYGMMLNNLGIAYRNSGDYARAAHCYVTAIEADEKATDYATEEEREENMQMKKGNLEIAARMMAKHS